MNNRQQTTVPHSCALREHRWADAQATFFVTKSLHPKKPALTPDLRALICMAFRFAVEKKRIMLRAFVIMPDHWHGLFFLLNNWTLPRFMHAMMSHVGALTASALSAAGCGWQDGFFDTRIRSMKQFTFVQHYIENNPVSRGLAALPAEWDATSVRFPELIAEPWPWRFEKDI